MFNEEDLAVVRLLFAAFTTPVTVEIEEDAISIDRGMIRIVPKEIEKPSILGPTTVSGYVLERAVMGPGNGFDIMYDVDVEEITETEHFGQVAAMAMSTYAVHLAAGILNSLADQAMANEYAANTMAIEQAYKDGRDAFGSRDVTDNEYPSGTAHFNAWLRGWRERERE